MIIGSSAKALTNVRKQTIIAIIYFQAKGENNLKNNVQDQIIKFNRLFKQYDDIYRSAARNFNMPELALWILYVLREKSKCTQKDLVDLLLQPKQSIHSALRTLVKDGYVLLEYTKNNRKSKYIQLTDKGIALAKNTADQIVQAENNAFLALTDSERKTFIKLFEHLTSALREEMRKVK